MINIEIMPKSDFSNLFTINDIKKKLKIELRILAEAMLEIFLNKFLTF